MKDERALYLNVKTALQSYFSEGATSCVFEVTADGIGEEFKGKLADEILFLLENREARPDVLGQVEYPYDKKPLYYSRCFVAVEVKDGNPSIHDLFQAKKYGELYDAAITLLVSTEKPEERLLRLLKRNSVLLHLPMSMHSAYLCRYSDDTTKIDWWYPEEPRKR